MKDVSPVVLAFDIGGARIKAGLVRDGQVTSLTLATTDETGGAAGILETVRVIGMELLQKQEAAAIGASIRGIVDPESGVLLDVNEILTSLIGQPLAVHLTEEFKLPSYVDNDARMYALGEFISGAGRGYQNMVCLTLGTGIGCGVVLDGRILRGRREVAGILGGHCTIDATGPPCTCGNIGCIEAVIGTEALRQQTATMLASGRTSRLHKGNLEPRDIFAAASAGDEVAREIVQRFAQRLGAGIVTMIHAYDPDIVVLGGGMMPAAEQFLSPVQRYVDTHAWTIPRGRVRIVPAQCGDAAALVGVAELATGGKAAR